MSKSAIKLEKNKDGDMFYLFLPKHPGKGTAGASVRQVSLRSLIADYQGPEVILDFDKDGVTIGMEFLLD